MVGTAASTVAGGVGRLVDVRPTYRQIGNFVVKGASYESFDSSGLFSGWGSGSSGSSGSSSDSSGYFSGWGSGSSGSSGSSDSSGYFSSLSASSWASGVSGDSSGYFGGLQSMGSGLWGASGGMDASDSSGGISSYLPSGQSVGVGAGVAFGISAFLALFPVALILNNMIFMPLILRIAVAILVYAICIVNPFVAIPIYLYYMVRMILNYKNKALYTLFPFFGLWPLRVRQPTDGAFTTFFTWPFSYLDPDLSKERHVNQRIEYEAGVKLYANSLVDTLRLPNADVQKLGIDKLRDKVINGLMSVVRAQEQAKLVVEEAKVAVTVGAAVANPSTVANPPNVSVNSSAVANSSAVPNASVPPKSPSSVPTVSKSKSNASAVANSSAVQINKSTVSANSAAPPQSTNKL